MKGPPIPSIDDLKHTYEALQITKSASEKEILLWSQWARLDARLAEILVTFLAGHFQSLNPFSLRAEIELKKESSTPQALAVLCEFARLSLSRNASNKNLFQHFMAISFLGVEKVPAQGFFIPMGFPKPNAEINLMQTSSKPYLLWGFSGREILSAHKSKRNSSTLGKSERMKILDELILNKMQFDVGAYLQACHGQVHARTAERDLQNHPRLRPKGHTRNRIYFVKTKSA